ncbi:MAG: nitroreductase family protein, partial [Clostridia bacterium]|nr:nitroreductase family protein [Clostridia bacterium]
PTAKNSQPQKIYVIKSESAMQKVKELTPCHFDAPLIFIICGDSDRACILKSNGRNFLEIDCAIVQTYMMLKATELGLGTCWVGRMMPSEVKKELNLPENLIVQGFLVVGYASEDCEPAPRHYERLSLSEIAKEL